MRFFEIVSGVRIPVSAEEQSILDLVGDEGGIARKKLDPHQKEVARRMVTRGVLNRGRVEGGVYFTSNQETHRRF